MKASLKEQWLDFVSQKQSLGHLITQVELLHFQQIQNLSEQDLTALKKYWLELCDYSFLPSTIWESVLEIQGHGPELFDILTCEQKILIHTELCTLEWEILLQHFCLQQKVEWNNLNPFVSFAADFKNRRCRISLKHACLSTDLKAKIFIRFHTQKKLKLNNFLKIEDEDLLLPQLKNYIEKEKVNLLICGPTGSGKTTLLKTLAETIPTDEHLICIEDTAELHLDRQRLTSLVAQAHNNDCQQKLSMDQLCAYAMRMTPDRLVLGEIRGKEIISLSLLLNTGHQGLLSTVHASSAIDALSRLALLFCLYQKDGQSFTYHSVLKFLAKQFQKIIFIKDKKIQQVISIIGADEGNVFFDTVFQSKIR